MSENRIRPDCDRVFVVTAGYYSDFHIVAVRATREEAEAIRVHLVREFDDSAKVEEYALDGPPNAENGLFWWRIYVTTAHDEVSAELTSEPMGVEFVNTVEGRRFPFAWAQGSVMARDHQHALKIASEKRAELIVWKDQQVQP